MEFGVIRNKAQLEDIIFKLRAWRLPLKIAIQDIYPMRTIEANDYLWGFVYTPIANHTGQTPQEVHDAMKPKYNFKYDLKYDRETKGMKWVMAAGSTTKLDWYEIWDYIMKVRAEAEVEMDLVILMPNEVFMNELKFNENERFQTRRI